MEWQLKQGICERAEKQLANIDYLMENKKYLLARKEIIKLMEHYPNFWLINNRYVVVNHLLGLDDENIKYLTNVLETDNKSSVRYTLFECYYYTHQFDKAFELLDDFMESAKKAKLSNYRIYEVILMKKMSLDITLLDFEKDNYILKQIINYDKDLLLNETNNQFKHYLDKGYTFDSEFNLEVLCDTIQRNISHYQKSKELSCFDVYHIDYKEKIWDHLDREKPILLVRTIPATNQILSIQPIRGRNSYILNSLEVDTNLDYKSTYQKKKLNQIEKFYSRYHK